MPEVDKCRIKTFKTPKEFSKWLEYNHDTEVELWLKIFKKGSGAAGRQTQTRSRTPASQHEGSNRIADRYQ